MTALNCSGKAFAIFRFRDLDFWNPLAQFSALAVAHVYACEVHPASCSRIFCHASLSCTAKHIQRRPHTEAVASIVAVACACMPMDLLGPRAAFEGASVLCSVTVTDRPPGTACAW